MVEMSELEKATKLRDDLEAIIHPKRGRRISDPTAISRVLSSVLCIMDRYRTEAVVNDHHLGWLRYHAAYPIAVIIPQDASCKSAIDAAERALDIHIYRLSRNALTTK